MTVKLSRRATKSLRQRLHIAARTIDLSRVVDLLAPAERGTTPTRGRPVSLGQLNTRALLITLYEMALDRRQMSFTELTRTLWIYYADTTLADLGIADIRDAETADLLARSDRADASAADIRGGVKAEARARRRIIDAFERATEPINDNVHSAHRRVTNAELDESREANDVRHKRAARIEAFNLIVQGSLYAANEWMDERRRPAGRSPINPYDLRAGILSGWHGDLAVDETDIDHSIATTGAGSKLVGPHARHPISELAEFFKKESSRLQWPNAVGLTFAIAVSRPGKRRVPTVALAGSIDPPSAGSLVGALAAIDSIQTAGIRPPGKSNAHQYVVADMAYPHRTEWADAMLDRGYSQLIRYRRNASRVHRLRSATGDSEETSATLFNGVPICPGKSSAALRKIHLDAPKPEDARGDHVHFGRLVQRHDDQLRELLPLVMVRHGRPTRTPNNGPGRPKVGQPPKEDVYRVRVVCPAVAGQARCTLVPESMEQDPAIPLVPDPPIDAPPPPCRSSFSRLQLTRDQFRHYQPRMLGSWEHEDFYTSARSRNEGFHAALLDGSTGALSRGRIRPWKNAFLTLALALAVAATNFHIVERWDEVVTLNNGQAPHESHRRNDRRRKNAKESYAEHRRSTRRN